MKKYLLNNAKKFAADTQGAVALIVGIALVAILMGVLSLTIDLGRTQTSYGKNQNATDAAALGVSEFILKGIVDQIGKNPQPYNWKPTQGEMAKYAEDILLQNFAREQSSAKYDPTSLSVTYTKTAKNPSVDGVISHNVEVRACTDLVTPLSQTARHANKTRTCTVSTAGFSMSELNNLEVAFGLDFTNSMYWAGETPPGPGECPAGKNNPASKCPAFANTKASKLMDAMDYVFDTYFPSGADSSVYASIVPYSGLVNLYPYSKTMVRQTSAQPPQPGPHVPIDFKNLDGRSFKNYSIISPSITDFPMRKYEVLNRIPTLAGAGKITSIINSNGKPGSILPFNSYVDHFNDLKGQDEDTRTPYCYNGAIMASLDQRIEKAENPGTKGIVNLNDTAIKKGDSPLKYKYKEDGKDKQDTLKVLNGGRIHGLFESFPVQPLTNNVSILKKIVRRYTANSQLYTDNIGGDVTAASISDRQSNVLNKSSGFSYTIGTSSIHGLLWSWFTVNSEWKDRWAAQSVHESYFAGGGSSQSSRNNLPSKDHIKHIILFTDGHDNDGPKFICDAYSPTGKVSDKQYNDVCKAIKADDVKIHILLLDFNESGSRYSNCASSISTFHNNVKPDEIKGIMDNIFKTIITDLAQVKLVK